MKDENYQNKFGRFPFRKKEALRITTHLVDHCNLNCAHCDHFAPLAAKRFKSPDELEKDFKRLAKLAGGRMGRMELLGGEPLLHPELETMLDIAGKYFPELEAKHLVTNGVLLEGQPDSFWAACARNKVRVWLTNYPIGVPFAEIKARAAKLGAVLEYFENYAGKKYMYKMKLDLNGRQPAAERFKECFKSNECSALENGKIYPCSTIPFIGAFNRRFGTNLKESGADGIDIHNAKNIEEVFEFLTNHVPFCRYCDLTGNNFDLEWVKSQRKISEWVEDKAGFSRA